MTERISDYVLHTRPRSWLIVGGHMAVGFAVAQGVSVWDMPAANWAQLAGAWVIWTILMNGGTLALNTAYDKDEGDIGYLFNPPPIPRRLAGFALLLLLAGLGLSLLVNWTFFVMYAVCFVMSLLYSVPPIRFKARAGFDVLINCTGYGMLTFLAGYVAAGKPIGVPAVLAGAAFFMLYICFYPLTQFYQYDEDLRHGDRTLTVALGKRPLLWIGLVALAAAFGLLGWHAWTLGNVGYRATGLAVAFLSWCIVLVPWLLRGDSYPEKKGMYRALMAWAITDLALALNAVVTF